MLEPAKNTNTEGNLGNVGEMHPDASENNVPDPLCIYGCILCLLQFGPHITSGILLQHSGSNFNIKVLASQLQARLDFNVESSH